MVGAHLDSGFGGQDDERRQDLGSILEELLTELVGGSDRLKGKGSKSRIAPSLGFSNWVDAGAICSDRED